MVPKCLNSDCSATFQYLGGAESYRCFTFSRRPGMAYCRAV